MAYVGDSCGAASACSSCPSFCKESLPDAFVRRFLVDAMRGVEKYTTTKALTSLALAIHAAHAVNSMATDARLARRFLNDLEFFGAQLT